MLASVWFHSCRHSHLYAMVQGAALRRMSSVTQNVQLCTVSPGAWMQGQPTHNLVTAWLLTDPDRKSFPPRVQFATGATRSVGGKNPKAPPGSPVPGKPRPHFKIMFQYFHFNCVFCLFVCLKFQHQRSNFFCQQEMMFCRNVCSTEKGLGR